MKSVTILVIIAFLSVITWLLIKKPIKEIEHVKVVRAVAIPKPVTWSDDWNGGAGRDQFFIQQFGFSPADEYTPVPAPPVSDEHLEKFIHDEYVELKK